MSDDFVVNHIRFVPFDFSVRSKIFICLKVDRSFFFVVDVLS